jgi:hypothetical protein
MPLNVFRPAPLLHDRNALAQLGDERRHALGVGFEEVGGRIDVCL